MSVMRRIAAVLAILAFSLTCLLGALSGCSVRTALARALVAMAAFFVIGLGVGYAVELLLREHFRSLAGEGEDQEEGPSDEAPGRKGTPNGTPRPG